MKIATIFFSLDPVCSLKDVSFSNWLPSSRTVLLDTTGKFVWVLDPQETSNLVVCKYEVGSPGWKLTVVLD